MDISEQAQQAADDIWQMTEPRSWNADRDEVAERIQQAIDEAMKAKVQREPT